MTPTNDWQTELDEINEPLDFFEALKTISDIKESLALHLLDVLRSYEFPEDPEELHQDICMFNALCGVLGGFVPALKDVKKQLSKCLTIFDIRPIGFSRKIRTS